jgi:hypothetical protein
MTSFINKIIYKIRISEVVKYVNKNLTHDVFLNKKNEAVIFYNSKIYVIWIDDSILMLSMADPYTGSSFSFGTIKFLVSLIINDPYKEYGVKNREDFEKLRPIIGKKQEKENRKNREDKKGDRVNK